MTTIIGLYRKKGRVDPGWGAQIEQWLRCYLPQYPLPVRTQTWMPPGGGLAAWRADAALRRGAECNRAIEKVEPCHCLWVSGYAERDGAAPLWFPNSARQLDRFCRQFAHVGGVYSAFWLSEPLNALVAVTNITRMEPVYWAQNDECVVVGNRALPVHLVARRGATDPVYDPDALVAFLAGGFFADESVPFAGVGLLPPNTGLTVVDGRPKVVPVSEVLLREGANDLTSAVADELAETFKKSFSPLRQAKTPISVALTGGKDSRLIAAGLKAAGMPFRTYIVDYGAANAADVSASIEVARRLGVEHEVRRPPIAVSTQGSFQRVSLLQMVRDTLFVTDGMLSGYENVPRRKHYSHQFNVAGNGGELLRGGYAKTPRQWTRDAARDYLLKTFGGFHTYLRGRLADAQRDFLTSWISRQPKRLSGAALLDRFYLYYRCGRWSAAARAGYGAFQDLRQPLFDAQLIAQVQALHIDPRVDDRLNYELLRRLAPELIDLPFANKHWLFASAGQQAADRAAFPGFYQRPGDPGTQSMNLDWRTRFGTQLREEFRRQIFEGRAAEALFQVLDRQRLTSLFDSPELAQPANKLFLFAVYTLSVLLSNEWLKPSQEGPAVTIDPTAP